MRLPGPTSRTAVLGQTGSGKSTFGAWLLSTQNWNAQPWVIVDYKFDELLNALPTEELGVNERLPRHPGLYIVHPYGTRREQRRMVKNGTLNEAAINADVEQLMLRIWAHEKIGLFLDEGYLVPDKSALKASLVTGRSKKIPMIINSQRPVMVPRHVFSESNFFAVFCLQDRRDEITVNYFAPVDFTQPLPEFHSWYYDSARKQMTMLKPVPEAEEILDLYDTRLTRHRRIRWA